jgi:hypothetical protein
MTDLTKNRNFQIEKAKKGICPSCNRPYEEAKNYCGNERPLRKTLCQLKKGHKGSHRAVIFWEGEKQK